MLVGAGWDATLEKFNSGVKNASTEQIRSAK
jgi:hypothetical protein